MDARDKRIVALLQANARLTYQELGDGVGLSAAAAFQRVRKLEESGVIAGYHARIAPEAVGGGLTAFLRLEPSGEADVRRLVAAWEAGQTVEGCYRTVAGAVIVRVRCAGLADVESYVTAARSAGCAVQTELVSATVFERWIAPLGTGGAE